MLNINRYLFLDAQIPLCSDDNDVQSQYEELLIKKLDFPRSSANRYGIIRRDMINDTLAISSAFVFKVLSFVIIYLD